jgi:hypothetical protein
LEVCLGTNENIDDQAKGRYILLMTGKMTLGAHVIILIGNDRTSTSSHITNKGRALPLASLALVALSSRATILLATANIYWHLSLSMRRLRLV